MGGQHLPHVRRDRRDDGEHKAGVHHGTAAGEGVADAPLTLFAFLNGHLLARLSGGGGGGGVEPVIDATAYPAMAGLVPLLSDFGSLAEFDRMLDVVIAGIRDSADRRG